MLLAEIAEDAASQAAARAAVFHHAVQPIHVAAAQGLALVRSELLVLAAVFYEEAGRNNVRGGVEQQAVRRRAVAPGAPRLLIVGFEAFRHVVVDDVGDVGLVYAHAESVCRHHDGGAVVLEILLRAAALGVGQPGVVLHGGKAGLPEPGADLFHRRARGAVDYAALVRTRAQKAEQLGELVRRPAHVEKEVRPVEARDQHVRLPQPQQAEDVVPDGGRRRRREGCNDGTAGQGGDEGFDREVARPEILSPLRDAVRLVHGDEGDLQLLRERGKGAAVQPLGRYVQQAELAPAQTGQDLPPLLRVKAAVEIGGGDAVLAQSLDLILHERDERRDYKRQARQQQGWQLVAQRLSTAGGHYAEAVPPGEYVVDEPLLTGTESIQAEVFAKRRDLVQDPRLLDVPPGLAP